MGSDSLSIGLAYLVCSMVGLPSSGASLNPARALGPSFVMGLKWRTLWVSFNCNFDFSYKEDAEDFNLS